MRSCIIIIDFFLNWVFSWGFLFISIISPAETVKSEMCGGGVGGFVPKTASSCRPPAGEVGYTPVIRASPQFVGRGNKFFSVLSQGDGELFLVY